MREPVQPIAKKISRSRLGIGITNPYSESLVSQSVIAHTRYEAHAWTHAHHGYYSNVPGLPGTAQKAGRWTSKCGVRTIADPDHGLPYRHDRLIMLYLATRAAQCGPVIHDTLDNVGQMFELTGRPDTVLARLRRVIHCRVERPQKLTDGWIEESSPALAIAERFRLRLSEGKFSLSLTPEFMHEVTTAASISLRIVRALASQPTALDLYLWQATQIHRGSAATLDLLDPTGPIAVLHSASNPHRARQDIAKRARTIRSIWSACPYRPSSDGRMLIYESPDERLSRHA